MTTQVTSTTTTSEQDKRAQEKSDKSQVVVVDLGKRQTTKRIKELRKGHGKLMTRVQTIVSELADAGTIKSTAQPVVIIVREKVAAPWPFG